MTDIIIDEPTRLDALKLFELALIEDVRVADLREGICCTTDAIVPLGRNAMAAVVAREAGVVCGLSICQAAVQRWAPQLKLDCQVSDGQRVEKGATIAQFLGDAHLILVIERTCLNFICRLSGISTLTRQFVEQVAGSSAKILDTRKTTPGWRRLEKFAVVCGGGSNHRMGLYDAVMIKDNHLAFMRSEVADKEQAIPLAIDRARQWIREHASELPHGENTILQVEVDTLPQLQIALASQPHIVLLDNMSNEQLAEAVRIRNDSAPSVLLEASGGVDLATVADIAQTGVERISVGALTHSASNFDVGLDWRFDE